ncbi:hypothetical protein HYW19_01190 [Candidatus Woesearchaeota archaeon]|nr:hypothetical protein [Candidatus Woesearchaeota archaeon]
MGGNKFIVFVMYIALLVAFLGLISMIFDLHRFAFYLEFLILLVLFLIGIIAAIGISHNMRWAWILLALFFGFVFLNMIFIKAITTANINYFMHLIVVAVAGFFISLFSIEKEKVEAAEEETVTKIFTPGKYIASKTGTKFHSPKCDWGKKVKKINAVWFNTKEEAKEAGYKADDCIR